MSMELPGDYTWDEMTLETLMCAGCDFWCLGVRTESKRGSLDSEAISYIGYRVDAVDLWRIEEIMKRCPDPTDRLCNCEVHQSLGRMDDGGDWNGLEGVPLDRTIPHLVRAA